MHKHIEWDEPGSASVAALFKDDPEHTPPTQVPCFPPVTKAALCGSK
jgi:hypothetical protein